MIEVCPDAFLFKDGLSLEQQKQLVEWYKSNSQDFYRPVLRSGHKMSLTMTCLGHHWSAVDYEYHNHRLDIDNQKVKPVDPFFVEMAKPFSQACFKDAKPEWDICIANYYELGAKLGVHSDNSETADSLSGKPIVSFSIGASCNFRFGGP